MNVLGNGLYDAEHYEDALSVDEARLSLMRRLGASADNMLITQGNLACTYEKAGRDEQALSLRLEVYSGRLKLSGNEARSTIIAANNLATTLCDLHRFKEAKSVLRKIIPVTRRVHGEGDRLTLKTRWSYAEAFYKDDAATLDNLREAVTTLEDLERIARRVFGGTHPLTVDLGNSLQDARAALASREMTAAGRGTTRAGDVRALREAVAAMSTTSD